MRLSDLISEAVSWPFKVPRPSVTEAKKKALWAGVILDNPESLISWFKNNVSPLHTKRYAHHMTIFFKPSPSQMASLNLGSRVKLRVTGYASDEKAQAAEVSGYAGAIQNKVPHITVSTDGTSPVYSNKLLARGVTKVSGPVLMGRVGFFDGMDRFSEHVDLAASLDETFASVYGSKNKWTKITKSDLKKNPDLADELNDLLKKAYASIGGHSKIKSASDLSKEASFISAIDIDKDPEADAVSLGKTKGSRIKSIGLGHDGSREAKDTVLAYKGLQLKSGKQYAEMSGAIAHIMMTKYGVPSVGDQETVEKVLGKKVDWVGKHPDGKYPKNTGWYKRSIGGKVHMKILLGIMSKK